MKFKEIQEMSTDELLTKKRDLRQESLHLRLQQQSGQLEQPSRMRLLRRDVARVETVLTERNKPDGGEEIVIMDETTEAAKHRRGINSRHAQDARRRSDLERNEQDDRRPHRHARAAREVRQDREAEEEILRARRREQGQDRATPSGSWKPARLSKLKRWRLVEVVQ